MPAPRVPTCALPTFEVGHKFGFLFNGVPTYPTCPTYRRTGARVRERAPVHACTRRRKTVGHVGYVGTALIRLRNPCPTSTVGRARVGTRVLVSYLKHRTRTWCTVSNEHIAAPPRQQSRPISSCECRRSCAAIDRRFASSPSPASAWPFPRASA